MLVTSSINLKIFRSVAWRPNDSYTTSSIICSLILLANSSWRGGFHNYKRFGKFRAHLWTPSTEMWAERVNAVTVALNRIKTRCVVKCVLWIVMSVAFWRASKVIKVDLSERYTGLLLILATSVPCLSYIMPSTTLFFQLIFIVTRVYIRISLRNLFCQEWLLGYFRDREFRCFKMKKECARG